MAKKGRAYGKTALGRGLTVTGIEEYLKKIQDLGQNVDGAVKEAIDESCKPLVQSMIDLAMPHKDEGHVVNSIEAKPAIAEGNYISAFVGIDLNEHPEATHALYEEYGGHNKSFPAPFVRPSFDNLTKEVKKIQRQVLKRWGVPVGK